MPVNKIKLTDTEKITPDKAEILHLQQQLRASDVKYREQRTSARFWMDEANRRRAELDVAFAMKENTNPIRIKPHAGKRTSETTAVLVLSDWHVEEVVDPSTINGKNAYNLEIADARIQTLFQKALTLTEIWRKQTTVKTLMMPLLGDFISGYIHEELEEGNQLSPTEAIIWVQKRIVGGIQMLLDAGEFDEIYVPCCIGNHGRTVKKPRVASAYRNSYEWLMYHNMAMLFKTSGDTRVKFQVENGYHNYVEVYGRQLRLHHGDWFNYREGIGGISVPVNKGILRWNKTRDTWLDIFGHWHQAIDGGSWICNPSLIGYNPFALKIKATYEPPAQTMVFIEKDHGKTAVMPIWVDSRK